MSAHEIRQQARRSAIALLDVHLNDDEGDLWVSVRDRTERERAAFAREIEQIIRRIARTVDRKQLDSS
jgi:hypothetical protein